MSIEAMKQALDDICGAKLCEVNSMSSRAEMMRLMDKAIAALRQAIAEAEKQEPVAWIVDGEIKVRLDMAGKLYYSETNVYEKDVVEQAIQQEPVAFVSGYTNGECVVMPMNPAVVFSVGTALYNAPVHAIDMSQKRVDETAKSEHDLWIAAACLKSTVESAIKAGDWKVDGACDPTRDLAYLANCLANPKREWVGQPDLAAVGEVGVWGDKREWVGLDDDIPGLGLVTEEFYNGMLCAEDILRKRNT